MVKSDRKIIDKVFVRIGAIVTVLLLVVAGLTWYGYNFATDSVRTELAAQKVYFPPKGSAGLDPKEFPDLQQYAGKIVDDGPTAKAYANGFIGRHIEKIADGKTYSEVSTLSMKDPTNVKLQGQKQALFMGETLRGLLLGDGYAYWTFGQIALYVSIASFVGACITAFLVLLGLRQIARLK